MAGVAVFLASAASDFVTGTAIPVDGGYSVLGERRWRELTAGTVRWLEAAPIVSPRTMSIQQTVAAFLVLAFAAGCATRVPQAVAERVRGHPRPEGAHLPAGQVDDHESPTVKAARLVYRGRLEVESLGLGHADHPRGERLASRQQHAVADQGVTQIYEKAGSSLEVRLLDGWWFTFVELTASRSLQHGLPRSRPRASLHPPTRAARAPPPPPPTASPPPPPSRAMNASASGGPQAPASYPGSGPGVRAQWSRIGWVRRQACSTQSPRA